MQYFDDNAGGWRRTLDEFLVPGEKWDEVHLSGSQCLHVWERCVHHGVGSQGSNPACRENSSYPVYSHHVCVHGCGANRYPDFWSDIVCDVLEARRREFENSV